MNEHPAIPNILSALGHELRFRIWRLLLPYGAEGLGAGAIAKQVGVAPSSLSFHLEHMMRARVLVPTRRSRQLIYAANIKVVVSALADSLLIDLPRWEIGRGSSIDTGWLRQNVDFTLEHNVQDSPISGETLTLTQGITMPNRAARFRAVAKDEEIPDTVLRKLIDDWKATEAEQTRTSTGLAKGEPHQSPPLPLSHKAKLAAAKKLITGELPPLFARKRARRKLGKPSAVGEAERIASVYKSDPENVRSDEYLMSFVSASWMILNDNRQKNHRTKLAKFTSTRNKRRLKKTADSKGLTTG